MALAIHFILSFLFVVIAQVVPSGAELTFSFTTIRQCEPFTVTFASGNKDEVQRQIGALSIIPLESAPVVIPMTRVNTNTNSFRMTSIPLAAGTRFIASLEDAEGRSIARVSELITVLRAEQGQENSSCLPTTSEVPRRFALQQPLTQCEEFAIQYNKTLMSVAPRVKVYNPAGISLVLNATSDDPASGTAKYIMTVSRGKQVTLLIDGGSGIRETTSLITVSGDDSSPSGCLKAERDGEALLSGKTVISSRAIIIGASSGGGAVVIIGLAMAFFIIHDRRRRRIRRMQALSFDGSRMFNSPAEKFTSFPATRRPTIDTLPRIHTGSVVDPTYSSTQTGSPRDLADRPPPSWVKHEQWTRAGHISRPSLAQSETRNIAPHANYDADHLSLNSLDIEGMLNMATLQAESPSRKSSMIPGPESYHSGSLRSPEAINRSLPSSLELTAPRRTLKVNSDIPDGALSETTSMYSFSTVTPTNPFNPEEDIVIQAGRRYQPTSVLLTVTRTPGGSMGVPASPRDVLLSPGRASIAGSSARNSAEWYGIGIAR